MKQIVLHGLGFEPRKHNAQDLKSCLFDQTRESMLYIILFIYLFIYIVLILGVEPNLTAYKTVVRTDTLYELFVTSFVLKIIFYFELLYETTPPIIFYIYDHPRTRTWNLLIRSQVRCPITA